MIFFTPAFGVPSQELLQDTLKSIIVSAMALGCGLFFFWQQRKQTEPLIWHGLMWLPLLLAAYALFSMVWAHTYLAGVEAARWIVFSLIVFLTMNTRLEDSESRLLWGIHWGITVASFWGAWQFWGDFAFFPQSYNPASTFVNRNFFAEYAICALPYCAYLVLRARDLREAYAIAAIAGFNVAALMMSGTRSALTALLVLCFIAPPVLYRFRQAFGLSQRSRWRNASIALVALAALAGFGSISTGNASLIAEFGQKSAITRALDRTATVTRSEVYTKGSFSVRTGMWAATLRMISANPLRGVGAGAWEVQIPLFQNTETPTETDYYAHNEILQLLAEYGLAGWLFLLLLLSYLVFAAWNTWTSRSGDAEKLAPLRMTALASILMLLIVSNAGFPWRMAGTGALFAISLGLLAATDAELKLKQRLLACDWDLKIRGIYLALTLLSISLMLAVVISQQAAKAEGKLVQSLKLAVAIANSGDPRNPAWDAPKATMLNLVREGIAINPHYRKLTPSIGDEMARWGDWGNALWIWESVLESRPYVVALICNIARSHLELGNLDTARVYFERAQRLQPAALTVLSLEVEILARSGQIPLAIQRVRAVLQTGKADYYLTRMAYLLGRKVNDYPLMIQALEIRIQRWPLEATEGWLKLGDIYADQSNGVYNPEQALSAYDAALKATPEQYRAPIFARIPPTYQALLKTGR